MYDVSLNCITPFIYRHNEYIFINYSSFLKVVFGKIINTGEVMKFGVSLSLGAVLAILSISVNATLPVEVEKPQIIGEDILYSPVLPYPWLRCGCKSQSGKCHFQNCKIYIVRDDWAYCTGDCFDVSST